MRNLYSDSDPARVDNPVADAITRDLDGLPKRLLTAFEVAKFVGCHEETRSASVLARAAQIATLRRQRKEVSS